MSIARLTQKLYAGIEIDMYDIDLSARGGPILHFTNWTTEEGEMITWRGNKYEPVAMEASGYEVSGEGKLARPKLTVANSEVQGSLGLTLTALCSLYGDFISCKVTRWRTFRQFLDDGESPDPSTHYPVDIFKVRTKLEETPLSISWELGAPMDEPGVQLPKGIMTQKYCDRPYRIYDALAQRFDYSRALCHYHGAKYFNEQGVEVTDPKLDKASKRLDTCCRKRFGTSAPLPIGAFPGMVRLTRRN